MIVNLENVNDNTPVFSQREYLFAVREVRIQSKHGFWIGEKSSKRMQSCYRRWIMFSHILLFFRVRTSITTRLLVRSLRLILTVILIILPLDKSFTASSTNRVRTYARTLICGIQADESLLAAFERNPCAHALLSCYQKAQALTIHNSNSSIKKPPNSNFVHHFYRFRLL